MELTWGRIAFGIGIAAVGFGIWLMNYARSRGEDLNAKKFMMLRILSAFCVAMASVLMSYRHPLPNLDRLPGGRFTVSIPIFLAVLLAFRRKPVTSQPAYKDK